MPDFIIHVGPNKTGTTSIQRALHRSRSELLERGVYYPSSIPNAYFPEQHADLAILIRKNRFPEVADYLADKVARAVDKHADIIFLSSEVFSNLIENDNLAVLLRETAKYGKNKVIYVNRRIEDRMRSLIMQHITGNLGELARYDRDFDRLIETKYKWLKSMDKYFLKLGAKFIPFESLDKNSFPADFVEKATGLHCEFLKNENINRTSGKTDNPDFHLLSYPVRLLVSLQENIPIESDDCFNRAQNILSEGKNGSIKRLVHDFEQFLISRIDNTVKLSD